MNDGLKMLVWVGLTLCCLGGEGQAATRQTITLKEVTLRDAVCVFWKGAPNAAVYFTLTLPEGVEGVLTGVQLVSEGVADRAELHTHVREGNIMRMAKVDQMAIPGTLELKPGGDHVMVMGMKRDLKVGETINLLLTLDQGEPIPVTVTVAPPAWTPTPPSQKGSSCCGAH